MKDTNNNRKLVREILPLKFFIMKIFETYNKTERIVYRNTATTKILKLTLPCMFYQIY